MVYINSDGTICQNQPWGLNKLTRLFYGIISFIVLFFQTLIGMDTSSSTTSSGRYGSGSSFRGSGGGGGGGGGSGGGPNHRPGGGPGGKRFFTMRDVNPPTIGGCPGGSCGM